jgi:hypothetical protein
VDASPAGTNTATTPGTVTPASTVTTIVPSSNPAQADGSGAAGVTFAVVVSAPQSGIAPTGTVTLTLDGATVLNNVTLSSGEAFYSTALAVGSHNLTATYHSSNTNQFQDGTMGNLGELVVPAPKAPPVVAPPQFNVLFLSWTIVRKKGGKRFLRLRNIDPNNPFIGFMILQNPTGEELRAVGGSPAFLVALLPGGFSVDVPFGNHDPKGGFNAFFVALT